MRCVRKRRELIKQLVATNGALAEARVSFQANRDYQPTCMGGVEDKYEWERQSLNQVIFWGNTQERLAGKLGMKLEKAMRFK
jgi:hypothetical protein